jgi:hypothetical protein
MRDSVATEIGDQTVPSSSAGETAVSRAAEEPERRTVPDGARPGSAAGRGRWSLWAIVSFLFVLGIAVSTIMVRSERNEALDAVVETGHDQAQLAAATLTGKQLTKPATGPSYDKLAAKIAGSDSSDGTVVGVTMWSSRGRILFSSNESRVGETPAEMRSLIRGVADGSGSSRVVDDTVQTFTPVSKRTHGRVAVVEIDQPVAVVEAQIGGFWSALRLALGVGLAVSLVLLVLALVRPGRHARARKRDVGAETNAEEQPEDPPTHAPAPTYEEVFGLPGVDETVEPDGDVDGDPEARDGDPVARDGDPVARDDDPVARDGDPESLDGDPEAMKSIRQWDEAYEDLVLEELKTQELMRQRREEFKTRAEAAALRVKKQEAGPDEAPPTPD